MAERPVFIATKDKSLVKRLPVAFQYSGGFALSQQQKSIRSLHAAFLALQPEKNVLEISTRSEKTEGIACSAFNLKLQTQEGLLPIEQLYQGGKCFERGGPYKDLLQKTAREAKKDDRLKNSGKVTGFELDGIRFPAEPCSFFYNWLYCSAIHRVSELRSRLAEYDAFTDIAFNPKKSLSCQAESAAIYVSLCSLGLQQQALSCPGEFLRIVYGMPEKMPAFDRQMSLFDL